MRAWVSRDVGAFLLLVLRVIESEWEVCRRFPFVSLRYVMIIVANRNDGSMDYQPSF